MVIVRRAIKEWSEMTSDEMHEALRHQEYCDPLVDKPKIDDNIPPAQAASMYMESQSAKLEGCDYRMLVDSRKKQYIAKCKEEGVSPR